MIILGLDPGTATTGFGIIECVGNQTRHIHHGCITTPSTMAMPDRLLLIAQQLRQLIDEHAPEHVAIEELFFTKNVSTAITVAQARGVLIQTSAEAGLPVHSYTPLQVKQALTSYGRADKKQMQKMITMVLGLSAVPTPDDAADALAIAVTCAHCAKLEELTV